jgi:hypothetical protein
MKSFCSLEYTAVDPDADAAFAGMPLSALNVGGRVETKAVVLGMGWHSALSSIA